MKKIFITSSLFLLMVTTYFAQNTADLFIVNPTVTGSKFSWEIHIKPTNDWGSSNRKALGDCSWYFDFNELALNNPVITYVSPEAATSGGYTNTTGITSDKVYVSTDLDANSYDGVELTPNQQYHVYTVEMDITDANQSSELVWDQINTGIFTARDASVNESYYGNSNTPLPVELTSFSVNSVEGAEAEARLQWETATEVNNYGFEVERAVASEENGELKWSKVAFVEGHGNSNSAKTYTFSDKNLVGGSKFQYRLKQVDFDGKFEYSDVVEVEIIPNKYELLQNYPNPFNPTTNIKFSIPEDAKIKINIYNVLGELVGELLNKQLEAGFHQVKFRSNVFNKQLTSGIYFYSIESKNFSQVKKMMLLK